MGASPHLPIRTQHRPRHRLEPGKRHQPRHPDQSDTGQVSERSVSGTMATIPIATRGSRLVTLTKGPHVLVYDGMETSGRRYLKHGYADPEQRLHARGDLHLQPRVRGSFSVLPVR